jgi:hypothetical protein
MLTLASAEVRRSGLGWSWRNRKINPIQRSQAMSDRRELYRSPNGDSWFLGRDPSNGLAIVIHQPNGPSGAHISYIELAQFLAGPAKGPEHQALLRLIATLVEVPPFGDATVQVEDSKI